MTEFLRSELENAQHCLLQTFELAAAYGDNEEKDTSKYLQLMESLCQIREDSVQNERALKLAMEERTIADFESTFQREINKYRKPVQAKMTREYKAFSDRLDEIANVNERSEARSTNASKDGAFFEMDIQVNLSDPITKKRMVDPVKNTICNHSYEKSSIQGALKINSRLRCPVAGCGNNRPINEANLKPDNALKIHLQRLAQAEESDEAEV